MIIGAKEREGGLMPGGGVRYDVPQDTQPGKAMTPTRRDMPMPERTPTTSETLLRELAAHPESPRAGEFARLYEPVLRRYVAQSRAFHQPIQTADRDDLVQEVFAAVFAALPGFRYDRARGRFRAYLRRCVRNAVLRFQRQRSDSPLPCPETIPQPVPDTSGELALQVWTLALARVFRNVAFAPNTKAIFRRAVLENTPAEEVVREFECKPGTIRQVRKRVFDAVRAELDRFGLGRLSLEDLADALLAAEQSS